MVHTHHHDMAAIMVAGLGLSAVLFMLSWSVAATGFTWVALSLPGVVMVIVLVAVLVGSFITYRFNRK